jgi:hypothetical protein
MLTGGCHCGAIRYEIASDPINSALCHCVDCQRNSGAPMVAWLMVEDTALEVRGEPVIYPSSEHARRYFCVQCGTGLFYSNAEMLPGLVDVQVATLDEPGEAPPENHFQTAERIEWMETAHTLPQYDRFKPRGEGAPTTLDDDTN